MNCTPPTVRRVPALLAMCAWCGMFTIAPISLAQPVETNSTEAVAPAAPDAAAEGDSAAPARSVLWPDFQVGQRVVLEMSYVDTSKFSKPILATINVEVIDKIDDVFTIRWTPSNTRIPRDLPNRAMAHFMCVWNGTAGPSLDILIQENVGVIGLANWEAARDHAVAEAKKSIIGLKGTDGVEITPEMADTTVGPIRDAILANKDAAESSLLRNVRGYFDGAYHEILPGETVSEDLELPWPFGDEEGLYLPATRTMHVTEATSNPAPTYDLRIEITPDRERFKALVNSLAERLDDRLKEPEVLDRAESAVNIKIRWQFDTAKGWPTRASSTSRITGDAGVIINTATWTLVKGPTMKSAEPVQPEPVSPPATPTAK